MSKLKNNCGLDVVWPSYGLAVAELVLGSARPGTKTSSCIEIIGSIESTKFNLLF